MKILILVKIFLVQFTDYEKYLYHPLTSPWLCQQ